MRKGKILVQAAGAIAFFVLLWWGLSMLPWTKWFHINELSKKKERQLSELMLKVHSRGMRELKNEDVVLAVTAIRNKLCIANGIDTQGVKVHVFPSAEINAAAIPMGHILVYSELMKECDNPDMLAGVIAHEIAHIELNHVGKRFAREITIATIAGLLGENTGIISGIIRALTSSAFDREQESEADATAMKYLQNAGIDPRPTAIFFTRLSQKDNLSNDIPEWISTHPHSAKRAEKIMSGFNTARHYAPAIDTTTWENAVASLPSMYD